MMSTKALRDLFRECLGVCNVRLQYAMAASMQGRHLGEFLNKKSPEFFVTDAFNWHNSHEGWEFWDEIDQEWQKYLEIADIEYRRS